MGYYPLLLWMDVTTKMKASSAPPREKGAIPLSGLLLPLIFPHEKGGAILCPLLPLPRKTWGLYALPQYMRVWMEGEREIPPTLVFCCGVTQGEAKEERDAFDALFPRWEVG